MFVVVSLNFNEIAKFDADAEFEAWFGDDAKLDAFYADAEFCADLALALAIAIAIIAVFCRDRRSRLRDFDEIAIVLAIAIIADF